MKKLLLLAALASSSYAQSIKICANKTSGNLFLRPSCFGSERAITNLSALRGPQGPQGVPGSNVDMTKCHPAPLWTDNQGPNDGEWHPCSSLFCGPNEFLLSHHWAKKDGPYTLEETNNHIGGATSSSPGNSLSEPLPPILSSNYCGTFPEDQPGYTGDPYGSGTCCPLP